MKIQKIKGTKDYYYQEAKQINLVFEKLSYVAEKYGYKKIFLPNIEYTDLFLRSVGEETDIVNKELYTFNDKKGRSISLKPEGTASTVRLVLENNLLDNNEKPSLYYISQMYRYERPQKGRQREFFQFGVENFGKDSEYSDVELIMMSEDILKEFKVKNYELNINTIGDFESRSKFNKELNKFLLKNKSKFSDYVKEKIDLGNPLRVFDSKDKNDLKILKSAPKISEFLSKESIKKFEKIKSILKENKIKYFVNENLVRGLDYYNDLVFEYIYEDKSLESSLTIIGGGRYDTLVNHFDSSKNVSALGFAIGIERLLLASNLELTNKYDIDYYITFEEGADTKNIFNISKKLRENNKKIFVDFSPFKKLDKKIKNANKISSKWLIIITSNNNLYLRDLNTNIKKEITLEELYVQ